MSDHLMRLAKGQTCKIRVPQICSGDKETVVACHFRQIRLGAGMAIRDSSLFCAHGCYRCHAATSGILRTNFSKAELDQMMMLGVMETQLWLLNHGHIAVKGVK